VEVYWPIQEIMVETPYNFDDLLQEDLELFNIEKEKEDKFDIFLEELKQLCKKYGFKYEGYDCKNSMSTAFVDRIKNAIFYNLIRHNFEFQGKEGGFDVEVCKDCGIRSFRKNKDENGEWLKKSILFFVDKEGNRKEGHSGPCKI
jgi:hypothetical protein